MARLTWQNVEAPNLLGAGNLIGNATSAFSSAMDNIRQAAARAQAEERAAYSARSLAGLAGVKNPEDVGAFIQSQQADMLTPEALQVMLNQPGILLDRASKQTSLDDARADLAWQEGDRAGQLESAGAITEAQRLALLGQRDEALGIISGLTGHAARNAASENVIGDIGGNFGDFQTQREAEDNWGQKIDNRNTEDYARDYVINQVIPEATNKADAERFIMLNQQLSPKEKEAAIKELSSYSDEQIALTDPNATGAFDSELAPTRVSILNDNQFGANFIKQDISNKRSGDDLVVFSDNLDSINKNAADPNVGPQNLVKYLEETAGVSSGGIGWDGLNQDIDNMVATMKGKGITVSRAEVAAAIQATAKTSNMAFVDSLVQQPEAVERLLTRAKDPEQMKASLGEATKLENVTAKIDDITSRIQKLDTDFKSFSSKGNVAKAKKAESDIDKLLKEQSALIKQYNIDNGYTSEEAAKTAEGGGSMPGAANAGTPTDVITRQSPSGLVAPNRITNAKDQAEYDLRKSNTGRISDRKNAAQTVEQRQQFMAEQAQMRAEAILREKAKAAAQGRDPNLNLEQLLLLQNPMAWME